MGQLLGQDGIAFDIRKFELLGSPVRETMVMRCSKKAGIASVEKMMSADPPIKVGGTSFGDMSYNAPKVLASVVGLSGKVRRYIKGQKYTLLSHRENLTLGGQTNAQSPAGGE